MKTQRHLTAGKYATIGGSMVHILICDDDAVFAQDMAKKIRALPTYSPKSMNVQCLTDVNAMSAGELTKFDILFLDIDLGTKNGIELARIMRKHNAEAVLILVTNFSEYAPENKIISIKGKDGMTVKDVPFKVLHSAIEARMCEILATVRRIVDESGYGDRISSGAVLTGGSVNLNHIQILAKNILRMDVRLGFPDSNTIIGNSIDDVFRPEASVAAGLIIKGFEYEDSTAAEQGDYGLENSGQTEPTLFDGQEDAAAPSESGNKGGQPKNTPRPPKGPKRSFSDIIGDLFGSSDNEA